MGVLRPDRKTVVLIAFTGKIERRRGEKWTGGIERRRERTRRMRVDKKKTK